MIVGTGKHRYRYVEGWGTGPGGRPFGGVLTGIAVDSEDRVYVARRKPPVILVYDATGRYVGEFGGDVLHNPHGVTITRDDEIWVTDTDDHSVRKFGVDGRLLQTIGTPGRAGAPDMPFNRPAKVAAGTSGEIFVADGYGQYRVHRLGADGTLLCSWGAQGRGPGQFTLPHSVSVSKEGDVLVVDRESHRIQVFDQHGAYLTEMSGELWPGLSWPNEAHVGRDGVIYVAEAAYRISIWRRAAAPVRSPVKAAGGDWELLARWGDVGSAGGQFADCPHALCVDSTGSLYVSEVPFIEGRLQKFERV